MLGRASQPQARAAVAFLACALLSAVPTPARGSVFLNGVNIDGVVGQKFDNVSVVIDEKGNVLISAKGYEVRTQPSGVPPPAAPAVAPVTRRYFLVSEASAPALAQYDIDVFVNSIWIKRISSAEAQTVSEITRHFKKGKNIVQLTATKNIADGRKSASPQYFIKLYIGEGNVGGNNVMIDRPLLEYRRDASEMQSFAEEIAVEGR